MDEETLHKLLIRAGNYAAKYEKSTKDVRDKLIQWSEDGLSGEEVDGILSILSKDGFIDDERFAEHYISDKLHLLHKGPWLIRQELRTHGISNACIDKALGKITSNEWSEALTHYLKPRIERIHRKSRNANEAYQRLSDAAYRRGFSSDIFSEVYRNFLKDMIKFSDEVDEWVD